MAGFLVPDHYVAKPPSQDELLISSIIWGFSLAAGVFAAGKGFQQTRVAWKRNRRVPAYAVMVWGEWISSTAIGVLSWLFITGHIPPSFYFFFFLLCLWVVQIQCICGIIINRIGLLIVDPRWTTKIRWTVAVFLGLINISVFVIWIPAHLQIAQEWIDINEIWDRIEKVLFLAVDAGLNFYFIYLVRSRLIANGLTKYYPVFKFNCAMVAFSISLDIILIGSMSIGEGIIYIQFHPLVYILKLHIEMNMADLIVQVVRDSNGNGGGYANGTELNSSHGGGAYQRSRSKSHGGGMGANGQQVGPFVVNETVIDASDEGRDRMSGAGIMKVVQTKVTSRRREGSVDGDGGSNSSTRHLKREVDNS